MTAIEVNGMRLVRADGAAVHMDEVVQSPAGRPLVVVCGTNSGMVSVMTPDGCDGATYPPSQLGLQWAD